MVFLLQSVHIFFHIDIWHQYSIWLISYKFLFKHVLSSFHILLIFFSNWWKEENIFQNCDVQISTYKPKYFKSYVETLEILGTILWFVFFRSLSITKCLIRLFSIVKIKSTILSNLVGSSSHWLKKLNSNKLYKRHASSLDSLFFKSIYLLRSSLAIYCQLCISILIVLCSCISWFVACKVSLLKIKILWVM